MATAQAQRAATHRLPDQLPTGLRRLVASGATLVRRASLDRPPPLPTSISSLDRALGGGLPRGRLVEVIGRKSSGRFSLTLATLAATTGAGDVAALIDLGDGFDPVNAFELGVDLDRILWLRPKHLKPALVATEIVLQTGFPLVVLDLGEPPVRGGRGPEAAWLRLTRAATAHQSVVFVSSPYRVSGTAATTVFEAGHPVARWRGSHCAPRLLESLEFDWQLQKSGNNAINRRVSFALTAPEAFLGRDVTVDHRVDRLDSVGPLRSTPTFVIPSRARNP
ncbi:MAG: hypothetical protein ACE5GX_11005 [Thermoanaerobaculia bacterium]